MDVKRVVAVAALVVEAIVRLLPKGEHRAAWDGIHAHVAKRRDGLRAKAQAALDARKRRSS